MAQATRPLSAAQPTVPADIQDISAPWLTEALRAGGVLAPDNSVRSCEWTLLGEGEGFIGEIARFKLTYEHPEPEAPNTVIAKFPSKIAQNRALGLMFGLYEKEVLFYRELAPELSVRVPRCYYGDFEPQRRVESIVQNVLARLPQRVTVSLLDRLLAQAGQSTRRFGLIIEDMDGARVGDQAAGCSIQDAETALRALARVHARFWESPLLNRPWINAADDAAEVVHGVFRRAWPTFEARFRDQLTPTVRRRMEWADANGITLLHRMARRPRTLIHGDYRLDNLLFNDADADQPVVIIDWQAITSGNGLIDVAYFLRPNLRPEEADRAEEHLLEVYHQELVEQGVPDYSLEQCREDYVLAQLWVIHRGVILIGTLDLSHERGVEMIDNAVERAMRAAPNIDLDAVQL